MTFSKADQRLMAKAIRFLAVDAIEKAQSGHPGMPLGMADVATVLFAQFLKFNPENPLWPDRDRFVLSAGHGSMLLYALLHLTGYKDMPIEAIKQFRQLHSPTAGHPEYGEADGIETTTGPLGQGFANAVGMALSERSLRTTYGQDIVNHYTYVIAGDGCLMEGISQEALSFAGHQKLGNLIVLFDDNHITIDGDVSLSANDDQRARFQASGWHVMSIDGHNFDEIQQALTEAKRTDKPSLIACKTIIGKGAPTKQGTAKTHGAPLGTEEMATMRKEADWPYAPFEIPESVYALWHKTATRNNAAYQAWQKKFHALSDTLQEEFNRRVCKKNLPAQWEEKARKNFAQHYEEKPLATRKSSEMCLKSLFEAVPELLGGSADLTGSNNTYVPTMQIMDASHPNGHYINYGIREHAMGAIMNGIALHGGFIPYGGTFLTFSDYCRPAIRLAALMKQRVVFVMTHDSIGLGEDGPTHQPIEHLMSLRAIPNVNIYRPADTIETFECWLLALQTANTPSILALSRQTLPSLRTHPTQENKCQYGAYLLQGDLHNRDVTLIATGSEVSLAIEVATLLEQKDIRCVVVSMPSMDLFLQQPEAYKQTLLGQNNHLRVSIEAGITHGWHEIVGQNGLTFGIDHFGCSAPAKDIYNHVGLTPEKITKKILHTVSQRRDT